MHIHLQGLRQKRESSGLESVEIDKGRGRGRCGITFECVKVLEKKVD